MKYCLNEMKFIDAKVLFYSVLLSWHYHVQGAWLPYRTVTVEAHHSSARQRTLSWTPRAMVSEAGHQSATTLLYCQHRFFTRGRFLVDFDNCIFTTRMVERPNDDLSHQCRPFIAWENECPQWPMETRHRRYAGISLDVSEITQQIRPPLQRNI